MKRPVVLNRFHWLLSDANALGVHRQVILALMLVLLFSCTNLNTEKPLPAHSAANLELYGTFEAMGVVVTIAAADDPDGDTTAAVEYRAGREQYWAGFPLSRISDTRFVGSLFWLEPATNYDVRVTFSDPDGGALDGVTVTATGATRLEVAIPQPVQSYYVAPNGSGTNCTLAYPCSLTEGLSRAQPGDEVVLRGGIYYQGEISLPRSGTSGAPIVIRGHSGENAILDGADPQVFNWTAQGNGIYQTKINVRDPSLVVAAGERLYPYRNLPDLQNFSWNLPGFYATGTNLYVHLANDADPNSVSIAISRYDYGFQVDDDFIAFLNLTFRHYGRVTHAKAIFFDNASDNLVQGSTFALNNQGINIKHDSHRNVIQDNEFYDTIFGWHWDAIKKGGAQFVEAGGIFVNQPAAGRGNVIRRNTFHDMFDGFSVCPAKTSGGTNETDVYENLVYRVGDDGMQTDGQCSNIRIWGNTFHDVLIGISLSPVKTGPVYAIRNVIYNTGAGNNSHDGSPFKFIYPLSSDGPVYLFHNTANAVLSDNDGIRIGGEFGIWDSVVSRNNIWAGTRYALANHTPRQTLDFNYDDLYTISSDEFALWTGLPNPGLSTLADLQAQTGQEMNGMSVDPDFVNPASGDYSLAPNSKLIDAGVVIPGINDRGHHAYQGLAPDIGACELSQ
jgi:parallel beta-helix repeat protein